MTEPKPGWQTSEFWTMVVSQIIGALVLIGRVDAAFASEYTQTIVNLIGGLIMVGTSIAYIVGRFQLKQAALQQPVNVPSTDSRG